ncbi:hypothetical protein BHE74_00013929 [Ensete ventricosum]|nr:hypothetical protein BHE74_00013929 [Ensete ventricosum]
MPPPHSLSPLPTADPAAVFPISPRKPPPPLPPALIAASLATTTTSTLYRSPLARPCCSGRLPPTVRSVQPQPRDHLSAIAESGAVLCLSFIPTATPVANIPPSLAAAAASNCALCHCRSLLPLLALPPCHCRQPPSASSSVTNRSHCHQQQLQQLAASSSPLLPTLPHINRDRNSRLLHHLLVAAFSNILLLPPSQVAAAILSSPQPT